jgi:long-subunit acyl-CoA synthetase (AMP-forming)
MFVELASIFTGQTVFFAESLETFLADLRRARPTAMFGVPRIWSKFQMGVYEKVAPTRLDFLLRLPLIGRRVGHRLGTRDGIGHRYRIAGDRIGLTRLWQ